MILVNDKIEAVIPESSGESWQITVTGGLSDMERIWLKINFPPPPGKLVDPSKPQEGEPLVVHSLGNFLSQVEAVMDIKPLFFLNDLVVDYKNMRCFGDFKPDQVETIRHASNGRFNRDETILDLSGERGLRIFFLKVLGS